MDKLSEPMQPRLRNVVQINPSADALCFAVAAFASSARLLRLTELGPERLMTRMLPPAGAEMTIWLPDQTSLTPDVEAVAPILGNLRPCRLAVVHHVDHAPRIASLLGHINPDAICIAPTVSPDWVPDSAASNLATFNPDFDLSGCGLTGLRVLANADGAEALTSAFLTLDSARRRRMRSREHVYDVKDFVPCSGLYPIERDNWGRWAWTGPDTIATFLAPMHGGDRARLTLFFLANKRPLNADNLQIMINGRSFVSQYYPDEMKIEIMATGLGDLSFVRFDLLQSSMVPTEDHSRRLGFALHKLKVEVEP